MDANPYKAPDSDPPTHRERVFNLQVRGWLIALVALGLVVAALQFLGQQSKPPTAPVPRTQQFVPDVDGGTAID